VHFTKIPIRAEKAEHEYLEKAGSPVSDGAGDSEPVSDVERKLLEGGE